MRDDPSKKLQQLIAASPNLTLIWVTQAQMAIRSHQSQGSFANSLLIMYNTSVQR